MQDKSHPNQKAVWTATKDHSKLDAKIKALLAKLRDCSCLRAGQWLVYWPCHEATVVYRAIVGNRILSFKAQLSHCAALSYNSALINAIDS